MPSDYCTFCEVIAGKLPSRTEFEDDDIIVFHNQLGWVPVMLLLVPKEHITQEEMWRNGDLIVRIGNLAVDLGTRFCPEGYRLVSNVGRDAEQSQPHGHLHLIGGTRLGMYLGGPMRGRH